tara:strand:- start:456 stop:2366 length:1911 start_codon:yes stop_codon:yes gene_type:complete
MVELVPVTEEDLVKVKTAPAEDEGYDWLGLARATGQGLFNLGDEITAAFRTIGSDATYADLLQEERQSLRDFKKSNPGTALTAEIISSLLIPGGWAMKLLKGGKYLRGAVVGGGEGALFGAGAAEGDLADRAKSAIVPGMVGTIATPAVMKGMDAIGRKIAPPITERAKRIIQQEADDAGVRLPDYYPADHLQSAIRPATARELPLAEGDVVGDIPALQGLGVASTKYSDRRFKTQELLEERAEAERADVNRSLRDLFKTYNIDAPEKLSALKTRLNQTSDLRYNTAYDAVPTVRVSTDLRGFFDPDDLTPFVRSIYKDGKDTVDELIKGKIPGWTEADRLPAKIEDFIANDTMTMRSAHQLAKNMGDKAYPTNVGAEIGEKVFAYRGVRKDYVDILKELNPEFAKAVRADELFYIQKEAVDDGFQFLSQPVLEIQKKMASYDPAVREMAQTAYRSGILSKINSSRKSEKQSLAKFIQARSDIKKRLQATFPDQQSYNQFITKVDRLVRQRKTHDWLFAGSATQPKLDQSEMKMLHDVSAGLFFGPVYPMIIGLRKVLKKHGAKIDRQTRAQINRMLFDNPRGAAAMIQEILSPTARPRGRLAQRATAYTPVTAGLLAEQMNEPVGGLLNLQEPLQ